MKIKSEKFLKQIKTSLEDLQELANVSVDLTDDELNGAYDIYSKIQDVIYSIEDILDK